MLIVDSQVHIWAPETAERPWMPGGMDRLRHMGHRLQPIGFEELRQMMDAATVNRALLVPPTWDMDRVDLCLEASERYPDRFGVMGRIPVDRPEEAKELIRSWKDHPGMKGVRLTFSFERERDWIKNGTADWYWPHAEKHDIATMLLVPFAKAELKTIATRHPGLRLTVDHVGIFGNTSDRAIAPYIDDTIALSALPNVCVKLSNLPSFSTDPFPYPNLSPYIERVVRAFGAERCFWGTDLSRMIGKYKVGYREAIDHVMHHMPFLSEAEKEEILGTGVCRWLRWPL
jgi:predicted TIM-barrel fold metal-dependent hydrolase